MTWEDARVSGFCLGALLLGDRSLSRCGAIGDDVRTRAETRLSSLPSQGPEKVAALRALVAELRPPLRGALSQLPPRAGALLADALPRAEGRALLRAAPPARPDYEPPPWLEGLFERLARENAP